MTLMQAQRGAASQRQLLAIGLTRRQVDELVRRKELCRVRCDALVLVAAQEGLPPWECQVLRVRAVGYSLAAGEPAVHVLSHQSALTIHGLPCFGEDQLVHLCRTDGVRGRRGEAIFVHQPIDDEWVQVVDGLRVVAPVLAALQVAASCGVEAGVVCLDGVLRQAEEKDRDQVGHRHGPAWAEVQRQIQRALTMGFPNARRVVEQVVELADGLSESVGESRSRCLLDVLGFGPFIPQFIVRDGSTFLGRADLKLARWKVIVEFDGQEKYDDAQDLFAEKRREDAIRALGYEVVRLTWADLGRPELVRQKVLAAIARAEARSARVG